EGLDDRFDLFHVVQTPATQAGAPAWSEPAYCTRVLDTTLQESCHLMSQSTRPSRCIAKAVKSGVRQDLNRMRKRSMRKIAQACSNRA
ncbi:MAG: hypothetical protein ACOVQ0_04595, partial [Novosphingobium sp.]|uniref:hypothetical protein n=1 Tax=Novosphingobium sp. TaxID=1874826 RepID=UPI003B9CE2B2